MLRHPGDLAVPGGRVEVRQVPAVHEDAAGGRADQAEQGGEQRGLAAAGGAGQGDRFAGGHGQADPGQGVRGPVRVADDDVLQRDDGPLHGRRRGGAGDRRGGLQDGEDLVRRRQTLLRGVVLGADLPQRQVGLGGEQQHHQAGVEVEVAVHQAHADADGDQGHRNGRQQLQGERRQERDPQRPQRAAPVVVGDAADVVGLCLGAAEDLQGGEAADHVEEVPGQPGQPTPLPVHVGLRGPPDQRHEQRDEGQRGGDGGGGHPVVRHDPRQHGHGDHDGQAELREVAGEVAVQGVDAAGGQGRQFARRPAARRGGAEPGGVVEQLQAQFGLHRRARPVGGELGEVGHQCASRGGGGEQQQRRSQVAGAASRRERVGDDAGDQQRLRDHQQRAGQAERHRGDQEAPGGAGMAEQPRVDGSHSPGRSCGLRVRGCHREVPPAASSGLPVSVGAPAVKTPERAAPPVRRCAAFRSACGRPSTSSPGRGAPPGWPARRTRS